MNYLPKSKIGIVIAVLYLLLVLVLTTVGLSGGGHADPAVLLLGLAIILTLPTSWLAMATMDYLNPSPPTYSSAEQISMIFLLGLSAAINAVIIYLLIGYLIRGIRALLKNP